MSENGQTKQGPKFDGSKIRLELIPVRAKRKIAETYMFGTCKYKEESHRAGFSNKRLLGAAERHLDEIKEGFDIDEDSGCLHAAQVIFNMIQYLENYFNNRRDFDDRWVAPEVASKMFSFKECIDLERQEEYFRERCQHYLDLKNAPKES